MGGWVAPGAMDVGSYQVSGVPFVHNVPAANVATIDFKFVTSEIQVNTSGAGVTIHFGDAGSTAYTLPTGLSTFRVRCKKIVVDTPGGGVTASICASMTHIPVKHLFEHTQTDYATASNVAD